MKRTPLVALLLCVSATAFSQQAKPVPQAALEAVITETQRLELENAGLKLSIIQQRAQAAATPVLAEQQATVKAILAANPGFRYDANTDKFVRVPSPAAAPPAPTPATSK